MSSLTKKFTDEEMNAALGELLIAGEHLETAVYCIFKDTGFFASNRNVIQGYAGITDMGRILCCKYGIIGDETVSYNTEDIVKIKITSVILGQKMITLTFDNGKKQILKFQIAPKLMGSKFPDQERNYGILLEILEAKQNKL